MVEAYLWTALLLSSTNQPLITNPHLVKCYELLHRSCQICYGNKKHAAACKRRMKRAFAKANRERLPPPATPSTFTSDDNDDDDDDDETKKEKSSPTTGMLDDSVLVPIVPDVVFKTARETENLRSQLNSMALTWWKSARFSYVEDATSKTFKHAWFVFLKQTRMGRILDGAGANPGKEQRALGARKGARSAAGSWRSSGNQAGRKGEMAEKGKSEVGGENNGRGASVSLMERVTEKAEEKRRKAFQWFVQVLTRFEEKEVR